MKNSDLLVFMLEEAGVHWVFSVPQWTGPAAYRIVATKFHSIHSHSQWNLPRVLWPQRWASPSLPHCVSTLGPGATEFNHWGRLRFVGSIARNCHYLQRGNALRLNGVSTCTSIITPCSNLSRRPVYLANGRVRTTMAAAFNLASNNRRAPCISICRRMCRRPWLRRAHVL